MKLYHRNTGRCLVENLVLANTALKRLRGLLGRRALGRDEALWLRPCKSIHTFWMLFAIDVVFVDRQLHVVKIIENLPPFRLTLPVARAASVIELPAHSVTRYQLAVGDELYIVK